jgi:hypothetical protein
MIVLRGDGAFHLQVIDNPLAAIGLTIEALAVGNRYLAVAFRGFVPPCVRSSRPGGITVPQVFGSRFGT